MELNVVQGDITTLEADALIINLFTGTAEPSGATGTVNEATGDLIRDHIKSQEFEGSVFDSLVLHNPPGVQAKHIILIGLGKQEDFSSVTVRQVSAKSIQVARELKAKTVISIIHGIGIGKLDITEASQAMAEGIILGAYEFNSYKSKAKHNDVLRSVTLVEQDSTKMREIEVGVTKGRVLAEAISQTRDLINEPPSKVKPIILVEVAKHIAAASNAVSISLLDEAKLRTEGYNALLAVAAGSEEKPFLIHLHYSPPKVKRSIAFVGKGVTFDSGGLGIKPAASMRTMKADMAGAAAVLGLFRALVALEDNGLTINCEVHGVIVTTENMISGKAMRPDDIIETKNGTTIEIAHTDAEGRLILADGLTYANLLNVDFIIDYATLTGAAIRALGRRYSVFMGNNRRLLDHIARVTKETGELGWELPLPVEYERYIESRVADIQNDANYADAPGAIVGGLFLQHFVGQSPWAHIDIAGPSWQDEDNDPVSPRGATGYGIFLGVRLMELLSK